MGNGRGTKEKVFRFALCVLFTILVMVLTVPKAC